MFADLDAKEPSTMRPVDTVTDHHGRHAVSRASAVAAALAVVAIVIAGCGGGGNSPGVANVSTTNAPSSRTSSSSTGDGSGGGTALGGGGPASGPSGSGQTSSFAIQSSDPQKALKFSQCMRANGLSNFPDPNGQGVIQGSGIDPRSAAFQKAQKACAKYMGRGGKVSPAQKARMEAAALEFSQCMRSHGVPDFPDPQFNSSGGGVSIRIGGPGKGSSDLDPNSPIVRKAQKTCGSLLPGRVGQKVTKLAP